MIGYAMVSALLLATVFPAPAQEKKDATLTGTYKVEFRIRDGSDAAAKSARRFTMLIDTSSRGTLHVGDRVPVPTGASQSGNALVNTQWNYYDRGVNIEATISEQQGKVTLSATLDISAIVDHKTDGGPVPPGPIIAQIKIQVHANVPLGKPASVASIDDPVSQRKFDVEALVTKMD
jgi:hypothetical protein